MNLGAAYRNQGKHDAALQAYHTALTLGTKPEAYEGLGDTLVLMGDLDEAVNAFEESVKLDPTRTYSYQRLVQLCQQQGLTQKAEHYFIKMVSVGKDGT
jgi:tetratricopeptide (TPR) repeat protein